MIRQDPKYDLRYQYRRVLEASLAISLVLLILLFSAFKKFESNVQLRGLDAPAIQVEDIPVTRTVRKVEIPRAPTIPIVDPSVDEEIPIDIPDIDIYDPILAPPPPPPPEEEESVPFYLVEKKPQLVGGDVALAEYIRRNNLFPRVARETGISGKVVIGFTVDRDGKPINIHVMEEAPPNLGFGEAGMKAIAAMKFTPGVQRDRVVLVPMSQFIHFKID